MFAWLARINPFTSVVQLESIPANRLSELTEVRPFAATVLTKTRGTKPPFSHSQNDDTSSSKTGSVQFLTVRLMKLDGTKFAIYEEDPDKEVADFLNSLQENKSYQFPEIVLAWKLQQKSKH